MSFHHSPRIVTDGLVTYIDAGNPKCYPGTGTTVYNLTNPNETGSNTAGGFPSFVTDNLGCFNFNNDTFRLQCDVSGTFGAAPEFTIETWCNPTGSAPAGQQILLYIPGDAGADGFGEEVEWHLNANDLADGQFGFFMEGGTNSQDLRNLTSSIAGGNTDSWYNVSVVIRGMEGSVNSPVTASMYVNGNLVNYQIRDPAGGGQNGIERNYMTGSYVVVSGMEGESAAGGDRDYHGKLSSLKIYNKALTEQEVLQNFNALRGRFGI